MLYNTHVFLGPTLDRATATALLPQAHYHPPIQCGDLLRLMRLDPKRVVIIDGYFEFTPAVWHKEILYAIDHGIEVYGAASMGALRAAELHHYGMKGVGAIFHDFYNGILNDDDEVAVLHTSEQDGFAPISDAMVNIRATLEKAYSEGIVSKDFSDALCLLCKLKFYPYRSLKQAITESSSQFPKDCAMFSNWIATHGIVDLKKNDATAMLQYVKKSEVNITNTTEPITPMTGYLKTLLNYINTTPINIKADWLPPLEQQLQQIALHQPMRHKLLAELTVFMKQLTIFIKPDVLSLDHHLLLDYMHQQHLYLPDGDFKFIKQHADISDLYLFMCQLICETGLTNQIIYDYLPMIAHYYNLSYESISNEDQVLLKCLLVIILLMKTRFTNADVLIQQAIVVEHLNCEAKRRNYNHDQSVEWINPGHINQYQYMSFVIIYMHSYACVQSFNGAEDDNNIKYFKWIYCALEAGKMSTAL